MKLLSEIDDFLLGLCDKRDVLDPTVYRERTAARAIIFNARGEIALLHAVKHHYYKLPGGGMESGEDWQSAITREALEEIGCAVKPRKTEIGRIVEWRREHDRLRQVSLCGVADVVGDIQPTALTPEEEALGLTPVWVSFARAIDLLRCASPEDYEGKFITFRDLAFLEKAKAMGIDRQTTPPEDTNIPQK